VLFGECADLAAAVEGADEEHASIYGNESGEAAKGESEECREWDITNTCRARRIAISEDEHASGGDHGTTSF